MLCTKPYVEKEKSTKIDNKGNEYKFSISDNVRSHSSYTTIASEFINLSGSPVLAKIVATNSIPQEINVIVQHQIYSLTSLLDENINIDLFLILAKNLSSATFDSIEDKKPHAKKKLLYGLPTIYQLS